MRFCPECGPAAIAMMRMGGMGTTGVAGWCRACGKTEPDSKPGDVHVMPTFGRAHEEASGCWCGPRVDPETLDDGKYAARVWVHEVEQ